jgi:uncharacterized protein (TIGR02453 family)
MPNPSAEPEPSFRPSLFAFLRELAADNSREWFQRNKERYEADVRHPALEFISDFGPLLETVSRQFSADPRPVGGSLFRIHRDLRFSRDKRPFKTHIGIQFRHKRGKDVHAPGFYLHLEPKSCFAGIGIWRPDGATLRQIRGFLAARPDRWRRALAAAPFSATYELSGESLVRPPRGFDPDHPLIDDLKRKDFVAVAALSQRRVTAPGFLADYAELCRAGAPFLRLLCDAMDLPF